MKKNLLNFLGGIAFSALSFLPVSDALAEYRTIYDETHNIKMMEGNHLIKDTNVRTIGEVDEEENKFRFSILTENYNKTDWTKNEKNIPSYARYTNISPMNMGIVVSHPKDVEVLESSQTAHMVSEKNQIDEKLIPYEKNIKAKIVIESGKKIINSVVSKIPYISEKYQKLFDYMDEKNKEFYGSIFKEDEEHGVTMIQMHTSQKILGYTETARIIEIPFKIKDNEESEIKFWINPAFGDSSLRSQSQGTWPIGFSRLEGILVEFDINKKDLSVEKNIQDFFFKKNEIPQGYELLQLDEKERKRYNIVSNPGEFNRQSTLDEYHLKKMFAGVYGKGKDTKVMIGYAEIKSEEEFRRKIEGISEKERARRFLEILEKGDKRIIFFWNGDKSSEDIGIIKPSLEKFNKRVGFDIFWENPMFNYIQKKQKDRLLGDYLNKILKKEEAQLEKKLKRESTANIDRRIRLKSDLEVVQRDLKLVENGLLKKIEIPERIMIDENSINENKQLYSEGDYNSLEKQIRINGPIIPNDGIPDVRVLLDGGLNFNSSRKGFYKTKGELYIIVDDDFLRKANFPKVNWELVSSNGPPYIMTPKIVTANHYNNSYIDFNRTQFNGIYCATKKFEEKESKSGIADRDVIIYDDSKENGRTILSFGIGAHAYKKSRFYLEQN